MLADFNSAYAKLLITEDGNRFPVGFDPKAPPVWSYDRYYGYSDEIERLVWQGHILKDPKFWEKLEPLPEARDVLMTVNGLAKRGEAEVYFITHRMGFNVKTQTEKFLYEHGMDFPTVLLAGDKVPLIKMLGIDFFIDDRLETMNDLYTTAQTEGWLKGKHYFLKTMPYNAAGRVNGIQAVATVREALEVVGLWK